MSEITRYVLVDARDVEGDYEYDDFAEAKTEAKRLTALGEPHAVIERTYTYDDSELAWAPGGADVWPPKT